MQSNQEKGGNRGPTGKMLLRKAALIVLVSLPLSLFYGLYLNIYKATGVVATSWVSWYDDPSTTVYVGWETPGNTTATVRWGTDPANLNLSATEISSARFHSMNLTGLSSDTRYHYVVEIDGSIYSRGSFRTAPTAGQVTPFTFTMISDTQQKVGPGWFEETSRILGRMEDNSFVAMIGDFVEDGEKYEWNDFFSHARHFLDTTPIVPVRGNHDKPRDLDDDGIDESYFFEQYFPQSADKVINADNNSYDMHRQFYYSFNWSNVHFQVLHFPEVDIDDYDDNPSGLNDKDYYSAFTSDQLAWIRQDLANAQDKDFRISLFHCPITGAGFYGPNFVMMQELLPILLEYNVTVTVSGHAHHYERGTLISQDFPGRSLTYFVVGCGGGLTDVGLRPVPETDVALASPCYTRVTVTGETMTFTTFAFEGTVLDRFVIHE